VRIGGLCRFVPTDAFPSICKRFRIALEMKERAHMSQLQPSANLSAALSRSMHDHWGVFLAEGIILSLLGIAAIVVPLVAGIFATVFLGWLFLVAGIVGLIATLRARQAPGFGWALLSAVVAIIAGGILLWHPLAGLITLTVVLTAYFLIDGIVIIVLAIAHRRELSGKWEWMLINGIVDVILAAIVVLGLPGTLFWVLGLLVGIDLLFGGGTLIAMALTGRKSAPA
jgi:uncharacterized membrane protein HdeD (DUF308 family)